MSGLWTIEDGSPRLVGVRCAACGAVFVPPHTYGCESCGAGGGSLEATTIAAEGALHGFTTVFVHAKEPTPFQIGEVRTEALPVVLVRLRHEAPVLGDRVVGRIVGEGAGQRLEFVAEGMS